MKKVLFTYELKENIEILRMVNIIGEILAGWYKLAWGLIKPSKKKLEKRGR